MAIPIENYVSGMFFGNTILQYLIFLGYIGGAILIGRIVYFFFKTIVRRLTAKTKTDFDDILIDIIEEPIIAGLIIIGFNLGYKQLTLSDKALLIFDEIAKNLITLAIAWFVIIFVDKMIEKYLAPMTTKTKSDLDDHLVPLIRKFVKWGLVALTVVLIISNFGYNINSVLAGLGIGGLAFALAAQDLLKNIFGGIAILADKPFKMGDWIDVDKHSGTVMEIGLRSTRLKTMTGEMVSVPNSIIASTATINYNKFPKRMIKFVIGLTYDTTHEKIEKAKKIIKDIIESKKEVAKGTLEINFTEFSSYSLDIDVRMEVSTNSGAEMRKIKDSINIDLKKRFAKESINMAFPTQTIELKR